VRRKTEREDGGYGSRAIQRCCLSGIPFCKDGRRKQSCKGKRKKYPEREALPTATRRAALNVGPKTKRKGFHRKKKGAGKESEQGVTRGGRAVRTCRACSRETLRGKKRKELREEESRKKKMSERSLGTGDLGISWGWHFEQMG